jgi:hypothetical protein
MDEVEQKRKLYESQCGFEDAADQMNDAARLKLYCDTHVRCVHGHHYAKVMDACPTCRSCVPFFITPDEVSKCS